MSEKLTWLVTGCSSGLGEALVRAILATGDQVIATARDGSTSAVERLAPLKEAGAAVLELDVTSPEETLNEKAAEAWGIYGKIDVLVNNAAYIDGGIFEEITEEFLTNSLRTNALGPLNLTRSLLPYMRSRKTGTLIFMSSIAAYYGHAAASAYSSSKGFLEALVPCLALEVAQFGIRTCLVTPGYFRTSVFTPGNIYYRAPNPLPEYEEMNRLIREGVDAADGNQPGDPAKAVAVLVDVVKGQGLCAGKELPLRLPLGPDGITAVREDCQAKLGICDEWAGIVSATNF
ncbi:hypothetical protein BJX99DRAFT_226473, partial [Aspergillus californicus]